MCRNIKTLFNFDPPATDAEIRAPPSREIEAQKAKERARARFG